MSPRRSTACLLLAIALALLGLALPVAAEPLADSAILFIGDGMGPIHVQLARQAAGGQPLAMEKLPVSGTATTNAADEPVTDSAAAATALATGHKTNDGMVGVAPDGGRLETIIERARSMYKSTGIISTDSLSGATPASFAAHENDRGDREQIAAQMAGSGVDVMLGFWKDQFTAKSAGGARTDERNLIAEMRKAGCAVVFTKEELQKADKRKLVGLFDDGAHAPALADMVRAALDRLTKDPDGFLLVVESARIDWESHEHKLPEAIREVLALDKAVGVAVQAARERGRTLVVVTADHETGGPSLDKKWSTDGHTARPVPVFAFGPGSERFSGPLDNTDIPKRIAEIVGLGRFPR